MRGVLLVAVAAAGCTFSRPADVPDRDAPIAVDATDGCIANPDVCDGTDTNCVDDRCVDCPLGDDHQHAACTELGAPICGADLDCRPCRVHEECDSGVCAPDGTCATGVLYVRTDGNDAGGTNDCTRRDNPCRTLTRAVATVPPTAGNPTANRRFIRLINGGIYIEPAMVKIDNQTITVVGPPVASGRAVIDRVGTGVTLSVVNETDVSDVRLDRIGIEHRTSASSAHGLVCAGSTLVATQIEVTENGGVGIFSDDCSLTITASVIAENAGGAMRLRVGRVVIVNNSIANNGGANSPYGGLELIGVSTASVVQSNTLMRNQSSTSGEPDGMYCSVSGLIARNNIIYGDTTRPRVVGECAHRSTLYGPTDPNGALGTTDGNMLVTNESTFRFVSPSTRDYHLTITDPPSVARDKGSTTGIAPEATVDIDGEPRPQGLPDVGADEIP
jgi:hypothetical protein